MKPVSGVVTGHSGAVSGEGGLRRADALREESDGNARSTVPKEPSPGTYLLVDREHRLPKCRTDSPADNLLGLCPNEMLLLRRENAQRELLARPALSIHHICALIHVDGALREGCGLQENEAGTLRDQL